MGEARILHFFTLLKFSTPHFPERKFWENISTNTERKKLDTEMTERNSEESTENNKRLNEGPPDDDCCSICFDSFTVPCRSNCGHWFCGSCILQFWNYSSAPKPCKCPMCACKIVNLMPRVSLQQQDDQEVSQVLNSVQSYNLVIVEGRGIIQKVRQLPFFVKRTFQVLMDPDINDTYIAEMRLFAMLLSIIYRFTPYDFLPTGGVGIGRVLDFSVFALVLVLRLVGIYRRRRLMRRVRQVAAMELLEEGT